AKQHRPTQVALLDPVHVDDDKVPHTQQRQVLDHLVAERAGPDDQDARVAQQRLVPPLDALETGEPPADGFADEDRIGCRLHCIYFRPTCHAKPPAVISGCNRRSSPSCTPASTSVWRSSNCWPVRFWCSL